MSDAAIFTVVFGGLMVLRIIAATLVFILILPRGDHCPMCDAVTLHVHSPWSRMRIFQLTKRWCLTCGWQGYMRADASAAATLRTSGAGATKTEHPSRTP